jgi:hypothetical protein
VKMGGMASRFLSLYPQPLNSTPSVYAGGKLLFYASGTSSPLATYSDEGLSIANANPIILNSAGFPDVAIFLQNRPYKVVLKDSNDITITTIDPYYVTDLKSVSITKVGLGSPSGVVEGTAGSTGVLATQYWDAQNFVLYFCTTTGSAATAQWTAVNASAAIPTVVQPQGYLTLQVTNGNPIIGGDVSAATSVYYTPFMGNLIPIYNGSRHVPTEFTEFTLSLVSAHAANAIYDVFVFSNNGVLTIVTGPNWTTATAGAGARGTGAGTTQLTRLNGYWVNAVSMTGRNGSTTYSIGANLATYVGSIFIDGSNGQVTCHRAYGQNRKWAVWNAYNRQPIILKAGDSTASWAYNTATIRQSNGAAGNKITTLCGLAEETISVVFIQNVSFTNSSAIDSIGIGKNSTTAMSGFIGFNNGMQILVSPETATFTAKLVDLTPALGIQDYNMLEKGSTFGTNTFNGGEDDMVMTVTWRG